MTTKNEWDKETKELIGKFITILKERKEWNTFYETMLEDIEKL